MRIGVDLGGTKTEAIALNDQGEELRRLRVPTPRGDYLETIATIAGLVSSIESDLAVTGTVGVGIPGTIVAASGLVKNANSLWLNGQPLARDLSAALRREVRCANDANCFAVSEATDGAGAGSSAVFGVILGTGCGAGIVLHGHPYAGPNGLAGEWGHTPLPWALAHEFPGPRCYCGRHGCLETWISGVGFEADFFRATGKKLTGKQIVTLETEGDEQAVAALERLEDRVARGLAMIVDILDPQVFVLGGGLSNLARFYTGSLEKRMAEYTFGGATLTPVRQNVHGDSSGVRGAAWLWS